MDRSNLMQAKISTAVAECKKAMESCQNTIDLNRYNKLLERLEKLQDGIKNDNIFTEVSDLSIIRLIYEHDPKGLWDAVLDVNKVFREYYSNKV